MMSNLPTFPLFQWARQTPVFVIGGQIWMASARSPAGRACLTWNRERRDLVNVQTLEEMWGDYVSRHALALEDWQSRQLKERGRPAASPGDLKGKVRQMEILAFLSQSLIPRLQRLHGGTALGAPVSGEEVREWKRQLEACAAGAKQSLPTLALLCSAFPAVEGWGLLERCCYRLTHTAPGRMWWERSDLTLPQAAYSLDARLAGSVEIEAQFYDRLKFLLLLRASGARPAATVRAEEIEAAFARCSAWLQEHGVNAEGRVFLYNQADWRVFRRHGQWLAGVEVKPFALEDANGALYGFDGTLITTRVSVENQVYTAEVDSLGYDHPFLPEQGRTICMGDYEYDRGRFDGGGSRESVG